MHFRAGAEGAAVKGTPGGREDVDYLLGAKAGQRMSVTLHTDNPQAYFNILPPGSEEALFVGSSSGNRFDGTLPTAATIVSGSISCAPPPVATSRPITASTYTSRAGRQAESHGLAADFADGLAGGPDFWQVTGVPRRHPQPARRPLAP